jgi:hypothetical protein
MSAVISECGTYRYALWRCWMTGDGQVLFVMLNPSTADASKDDPTIRRCVGFAQRWGYASVAVGNLYGYRATKPADLSRADNPVGEASPRRFGSIYRNENDNWLRKLALQSRRVIAAWGANEGPCSTRAAEVTDILAAYAGPIDALGFTKAGKPRHPLYVKGDVELLSFPAPPEPRGRG